MTKVIAFTCSRHRPLMLQNMILQMAMQTYPVDCCVYINSDLDEPDKTDYSGLLDDIKLGHDCDLRIKYGKLYHSHINYMMALDQVDIETYDLFLKIDDDDVYRLNYVNDVVEDFKKNKWDFSGEISTGVINGAQWRKQQILRNLGIEEGHTEVGMPSTWAFSREAIKSIRSLSGDTPYFEDRYWREHFESSNRFKLHLREGSNNNYHYNIHGENTSTSSWLDKNWGKEQVREVDQEVPQLALNSFQAVIMAFSLLRKAAPFLPKDIYVKLRSKLRS